MSSEDENHALMESEPLKKFDTLKFRKENGAVYQVPLGQNDENESSEINTVETESSQADRASPGPRLADMEKIISDVIRESYEVGNQPPTGRKRWSESRTSQVRTDKSTLMTCLEHGITGAPAVAPKTTPCCKEEINKPKAEYYFPIITDGRKRISNSSGPRTIMSAEGVLRGQEQLFTLGDFITSTRLEAKMISNQLSVGKQVILDRATSDYVRAVSQLTDVNKQDSSSKSSEGRIDVIDGEQYYKPPYERIVGCIHCIQYYADKFIGDIYREARELLKTLPYCDIELFSISIKKLILAAKSLLESHSTRKLTVCGEICDWKTMSHSSLTNKLATFGPTKIRSSSEMLYELKLEDVLKCMSDAPELLEVREDNADVLLNQFINDIYQDAYDLLEYLPTEEARFFKREIKEFIESARVMQNRKATAEQRKCGLRCCNWFRKKEPVSEVEIRQLQYWVDSKNSTAHSSTQTMLEIDESKQNLTNAKDEIDSSSPTKNTVFEPATSSLV